MTNGNTPRPPAALIETVETVGRAARLLPEPGRRERGAPAPDNAQDHRARLTGIVIHGFALAQGVTAATLAQTLVGDEAALTALTLAMIISISRLHGRDWGVGEGLALIGSMAGFYLASRGAVFLVKWIPLLGNAANAVTSVAVAEILGWATYLLVREGRRPGELSRAEAREVYRRARDLRREMEEDSRRLVESMAPEDRAEYDRLIRRLRIADLPEGDREAALRALDELVVKYGG